MLIKHFTAISVLHADQVDLSAQIPALYPSCEAVIIITRRSATTGDHITFYPRDTVHSCHSLPERQGLDIPKPKDKLYGLLSSYHCRLHK